MGACPHVAGAAALVLHADPAASPADVAAKLAERATTGAVTQIKRGSPDYLLFTGDGPQMTTTTTTLPDFGGLPWVLAEGPCTIDASACVTSPNFPEVYGHNENCIILVNDTALKSIVVHQFRTERGYDVLTVNDQGYSGGDGPDGVMPRGRIVWKTDGSVSQAGWRLCMNDVPTPAPTTAAPTLAPTLPTSSPTPWPKTAAPTSEAEPTNSPTNVPTQAIFWRLMPSSSGSNSYGSCDDECSSFGGCNPNGFALATSEYFTQTIQDGVACPLSTEYASYSNAPFLMRSTCYTGVMGTCGSRGNSARRFCPCNQATAAPTTATPTPSPTMSPTLSPTGTPTPAPTQTAAPTLVPTPQPTTPSPTTTPTPVPTNMPTRAPPTEMPTAAPTTTKPTLSPTASPTLAPTRPTTESPTVTPTPVPTQSGTPPTKNTLLSAYWDNGECGPEGNNHNWEWCDRWNFKCRKSVNVSTDICSSGRAVLANTKTFNSVGNCTYAYYAQYECEVPDTQLSAYWDYGSCGPHGDNHNWDWCGTWRFRCPEMRPVPTELCASGNAVLVETKYFQKIGNCPYAYYAQYACGGAADSSSKRKGFLAP